MAQIALGNTQGTLSPLSCITYSGHSMSVTARANFRDVDAGSLWGQGAHYYTQHTHTTQVQYEAWWYACSARPAGCREELGRREGRAGQDFSSRPSPSHSWCPLPIPTPSPQPSQRLTRSVWGGGGICAEERRGVCALAFSMQNLYFPSLVPSPPSTPLPVVVGIAEERHKEPDLNARHICTTRGGGLSGK